MALPMITARLLFIHSLVPRRFLIEKNGLIQAIYTVHLQIEQARKIRVLGQDGGKEAPGRKCLQDGARMHEHVNLKMYRNNRYINYNFKNQSQAMSDFRQ